MLILLTGWQAVGQIQEQKLMPADGGPGDFFGRYLDILGDDILIGAHQDDVNGYASGSLYIFGKNPESTEFTERKKIVPEDGGVEEFFSYSIEIEGDRAVVGSHHDSDFGGSSGGAFVLKKTGNDWSIDQKLLPSDPKAADEFGKAVGISSGIIAAGAWLDDDVVTNGGSVYLFSWDGTVWTDFQEIRPLDTKAYDQFGNFLSIAGNYLAVGVPEKQTAGPKSGCSYVFEKIGEDQWQQQAKLFPEDLQEGDEFGQALSLHNNRLVVGAYKKDNPAENGGAVYVYTLNENEWSMIQKIIPADNEAGDHFGNAVAQHEDLMAVGAYFDNDNGSKSGSVYLFQWQNNQYEFLLKIITSDGGFGDAFGASVALDKPYLLSGAYADSDNGFFSGSAYVFDLSTVLPVRHQTTSKHSVYPTCFDKQIIVELDERNNKPAEITLFDWAGNEIRTWTQEVPRQMVHLGELPVGHYTLVIYRNNITQSFRILRCTR